MSEAQELLEQLTKEVEPNDNTLLKRQPFVDLLRLVTDEYVIDDLVPTLTREERYEIAKWASVCHVAAAQDDPPLPRPREPASAAKVLLKPGQKVVVAGQGVGVVEKYDYPPNNGGLFAALDLRPVVKLDSGAIFYPTRKEVIGVFGK